MRDDKKRVVRRVIQVVLSTFVAAVIIAAFTFVTQGREIPVLNPEGFIANQQYTLIIITVVLGVFVVIPVFILLFGIAWKYRADNKKAPYEPELEGNKKLEILWWGIPCLIILVLAVITYVSTHALDPYKKLESKNTPVEIQVISLKWNWLFIYPKDGTATLNYMNIPEDTPVNLKLTSDAPMNSFWVPALAGQVYAMSGMATKLHIMADKVGTYNGTTTNISGEGYADMRFKVYSQTRIDFAAWLKQAAKSPTLLGDAEYAQLSAATEHKPADTFMLMKPTLFDDVIEKYMGSAHGSSSEHTKEVKE